jgi:hypothetical protein
MHRTVLVVVWNADQIRVLSTPDHPARLGYPSGAAVENSIDQATPMNKH